MDFRDLRDRLASRGRPDSTAGKASAETQDHLGLQDGWVLQVFQVYGEERARKDRREIHQLHQQKDQREILAIQGQEDLQEFQENQDRMASQAYPDLQEDQVTLEEVIQVSKVSQAVPAQRVPQGRAAHQVSGSQGLLVSEVLQVIQALMEYRELQVSQGHQVTVVVGKRLTKAAFAEREESFCLVRSQAAEAW